MERHLHIITHDVPWPADYGGVVDLFYKIKALHQSGVKVTLHCFLNKRPRQKELEKYCERVHYYQRDTDLLHFSFRLPFIVSSRRNAELLSNLRKDDHPILLEGIHCSYYLHTGELSGRVVLLRLHNAEFEYYHHLAQHENNFLKKIYYGHESRLLKKYEEQLAPKVKIAAVSEQDVALYRAAFNVKDIAHLPVFLPYEVNSSKPGKGCFCLYHGNLSINENERAVIWLLKHVFNDLELPFVIAGKNPSRALSAAVKQHPYSCLVANPNEHELQDMIAKAQINILPSLNNTGVKLKLLNALFNGRHCLVNKAGAEGSGLEKICRVAEGTEGFKQVIRELYETDFTDKECGERSEVLKGLYCNEKNLQKIEAVFWGTAVPVA